MEQCLFAGMLTFLPQLFKHGPHDLRGLLSLIPILRCTYRAHRSEQYFLPVFNWLPQPVLHSPRTFFGFTYQLYYANVS